MVLLRIIKRDTVKEGVPLPIPKGGTLKPSGGEKSSPLFN